MSTAARTETLTLAAALDVLAREIESGDGVANAAIAEAAQRLRELERENAQLKQANYEAMHAMDDLASMRKECARLQMELDASCNAEELRQVRAGNAALRAALRECLDGIDYTVRVDAILRPEERHIGLETLKRHRSLLPNIQLSRGTAKP